MELIDIISTILLFGGGLLVFVVLVSFFLSKMNPEIENSFYESAERNKLNASQIKVRKTSSQNLPQNFPGQSPQIFQLEQARTREIKVIRKPTFRETSTEDSSRTKVPKKISGEKNRYTIVNEEQKKSRNNAVNFS